MSPTGSCSNFSRIYVTCHGVQTLTWSDSSLVGIVFSLHLKYGFIISVLIDSLVQIIHCCQGYPVFYRLLNTCLLPVDATSTFSPNRHNHVFPDIAKHPSGVDVLLVENSSAKVTINSTFPDKPTCLLPGHPQALLPPAKLACLGW